MAKIFVVLTVVFFVIFFGLAATAIEARLLVRR